MEGGGGWREEWKHGVKKHVALVYGAHRTAAAIIVLPLRHAMSCRAAAAAGILIVLDRRLSGVICSS